ncbi:alpha/beta hydrolase [Mycobacterium neglectum]|uniref:alpha/beta hydrolase n=1 Tax=Mycobacterium neglectum TaxID=242737 RepID=UPI000BFF0C8C|nr:alpha/beta hydrolase [Mycobacterium neglectum]
MVDRFLVWMSTGVVIAGVTAAVVAGAGVAMATEGDANEGGGTKVSESVDSPANKDDSAPGTITPNGPDLTGEDEQGDDPAGVEPDPVEDATDGVLIDEDALDEDAIDGDGTDETTGEDLTDGTTGEDLIDEEINGAEGEAGELGEGVEPTENGTGAHQDGVPVGGSQIAPLTRADIDEFGPVANTANVEIKGALATDPIDEHASVNVANSFEEANLLDKANEQTENPELTAVTFATSAAAPVNAVATATPLNILLDVIGTVVFGLYGLVTQLIGGPPMLPANSTVTVYSSRLRIDCGCAPGEGEEVPVDFYIPENPDPDRLIYLQHGFLAAGPWYSYTAAALAEQTNSIVVAPSITSNFLSYDQCWLGGAPMHQAMAGLFDPTNTALADSLSATEYDGQLTWSQVVLMGHSLGGGAVSGIAGYMTDAEIDDRLAGVVLLDGVGMNGEMTDDLKKVDPGIPIYQLAAPKYMWNMFGVGTAALIEARPGADFYGVTLAGGSHVDTMRGGNFLIQFSQQLVSGFSKPQNVAAAEILMVGWVNDMFDGDRADGIYLDSGETRTIDTPNGQATLVDLPNSLRRPYLLNFLEPFMAGSAGIFTLQPGCLRETTGTAATCAPSVAA